MNKEFITYEQAVALKELGFDEPNYFLKWYDSKGDIREGLGLGEVKAPLYQQAFRWFREKYNLKGFVSPVEYLDGTNDTYHWCIYNECNSGNDQLTHEEAELACLIKLIEIANKIKYSSSDVPTYYN